MMPSVSIFLLWLLGSSEEREFERIRPNIEQKNFWETSKKGSNIFISARLSTGSVLMGQDATIICWTNCPPGDVYLKQNELFVSLDRIWNRRHYEFYNLNVKGEHAGKYACCCLVGYSYHDYETQIKCSGPVELLITDPDLPRPNISLSPSRMAVLGSDVTIQCWPRNQNENIYLHKTGMGEKPQAMAANGKTSVFHIKNVSPSDGGNYYCSYRRQSAFLVSHPSDTEELWILDPRHLKPSITLTPAVVSLGGKATIKCQSHIWVYNFYLQGPRDPKLLKLPVVGGKWTQFNIWKVSKEDIGSYSCMYASSLSPHPVLSLPSEPVALLLPEDTTMVIAIASGVGGVVLVLFLGLGAFLWYKKRRAGKIRSTAPISGEPSFRVMKVNWKATSDSISVNESGQHKDLPPDSTTETQSVIYAELKHKAPPIQSDEDSADDSDGCVYTTVVLH